MTRLSLVSAPVLVIGVCLTGGLGAARLIPMSLEGHHSSLPAAITMTDGSVRSVTLEGVGCQSNMCSRVKARGQTGIIWLDGLESISRMSHEAGAVTATVKFKNGTERQASIIGTNRVLYVRDGLGNIERLDLGSLSRIDFAH